MFTLDVDVRSKVSFWKQGEAPGAHGQHRVERHHCVLGVHRGVRVGPVVWMLSISKMSSFSRSNKQYNLSTQPARVVFWVDQRPPWREESLNSKCIADICARAEVNSCINSRSLEGRNCRCLQNPLRYTLITWPHITILSLAPSVEKRRTLSPACNKNQEQFRERVNYAFWSEKGWDRHTVAYCCAKLLLCLGGDYLTRPKRSSWAPN